MRIQMLFAFVMIGAGVSFGETTATAEQGKAAAVEEIKSDVASKETRTLPAFDVMHVRTPVNVTVKPGEEVKLTIAADKDVIPLIVTEVDAEELMIKAAKEIKTRNPIKIEIEMPRIKAFDVILQSAGNVDVEDVAREALLLRLEGTGKLAAKGKVSKVEADLSGTGNINASDLVAESGEAMLTGTGNISIHVTGTLEANLKGTGNIEYSGSPKTVNQTKTGTGSILKK